MIHNYMCSTFVAKQILEDIAPDKLKNRIGAPEDNSHKKRRSLKNGVTDAMLYDEGSQAYKEWLSK